MASGLLTAHIVNGGAGRSTSCASVGSSGFYATFTGKTRLCTRAESLRPAEQRKRKSLNVPCFPTEGPRGSEELTETIALNGRRLRLNSCTLIPRTSTRTSAQKPPTLSFRIGKGEKVRKRNTNFLKPIRKQLRAGAVSGALWHRTPLLP